MSVWVYHYFKTFLKLEDGLVMCVNFVHIPHCEVAQLKFEYLRGRLFLIVDHLHILKLYMK